MASAPNTHTKLSKAKARLLMDQPFFATLLLRTEMTITDQVPMAATDGERMYWNPAFLEKLSVEDTMAVACHEVGHDSLLHSLRLGHRSHDLWNQACDHAINLMLESQGMKCPAAVPGGWLANPKYKGMSADRIYDDLKREQSAGGGAGGTGKPGTDGKGGKGGKASDQPGDRDWLHGDVLPSPHDKQDPAAQAAAETKAKQRVAAAANMARMAGKLSADLARLVDDCLEAKVPWPEVLRDYMLQLVKERENWSRRNRRFGAFYLPQRRSLKMGPIVFIPDTSGSMMGDDMEKICSEIAHCTAQTEPESVRVIWADAKVKGEQVFQPHEFSYAALEPKGGGGTDMCVPLKHAEQYDPLVAVLMTDCYTPWPDAPPPYPVICLSTTQAPSPDWAVRIEI